MPNPYGRPIPAVPYSEFEIKLVLKISNTFHINFYFTMIKQFKLKDNYKIKIYIFLIDLIFNFPESLHIC